MIARLVAAFIALTMLGAPLMVDLCQITCAHAESMAVADPQAMTHSCHETASPVVALERIAAIPHGCGHNDELPAGNVFDTLASALHAALGPSPAVDRLALDAPPSSAIDPLVAPAPPGIGQRAAVPLRI